MPARRKSLRKRGTKEAACAGDQNHHAEAMQVRPNMLLPRSRRRNSALALQHVADRTTSSFSGETRLKPIARRAIHIAIGTLAAARERVKKTIEGDARRQR